MIAPRARSAAGALVACALAMALGAVAAQEPEPEPRPAGEPMVQRIGAGVWRVVSDGAGHHLGVTFDALAFDRDGRLLLCCADGREAGEEVRQVIRFGDPDPLVSLDPYGTVRFAVVADERERPAERASPSSTTTSGPAERVGAST